MARAALIFVVLWSQGSLAASAWIPGFTENGVTHIFERTPTADTWWFRAPADSPYAGAGGPVTLSNTASGTPLSATAKVGVVAGNGTAANAAAYASSVSVPMGASGQKVLVTAKQVLTLPKLAAAARAVARVTGPLSVGMALYDWFQLARVYPQSDGTVNINTYDPYRAMLTDQGVSTLFPTCNAAGLGAPTSLNCSTHGGGTVPYRVETFKSGGIHGSCGNFVCAVYTAVCPDGWRNGYHCGGKDQAAATPYLNQGTDVANATDAQVGYNLENNMPANPPGVVKELVENGEAPEGGPTVVSGPSSQSGGSKTNVNPDGTRNTTNTTYNITYNNNTTNVTQTDVVQRYDANGTAVGSPVSTTTAPTPSPTTTGAQSTPSTTQQDLCALHPEIVACQSLGSYTPPSETLPQQNIDVAVTPVEMPGGSCPPDIVLSFLGNPVVISWEPVCSFADQIHFVVIMAAWIAAALIVVGSPGLRGGN